MSDILTVCYSEEEANETGYFIMRKGHEDVQNGSYRYCRRAIWWAFKGTRRHHSCFIYVDVRDCQMTVFRTKRGLRRNGLKYIEKK